jgi:hypothetical protein
VLEGVLKGLSSFFSNEKSLNIPTSYAAFNEAHLNSNSF